MTPEEEALLAELPNHPAWPALRKLAKARMEAEFGLLASNLMSGNSVAETDIEYKRGYFAGIKRMLDEPVRIEAAILRDLAKREEVKLDA